jgi:hypothetical protein
MRKKIAKAMKYTFFTMIAMIAVALLFPTWTPGTHYPQFEENNRFTTWLYEHFRSS